MKRKRLPMGVDEFYEFSQENYFYVDKTMFIADLLNNWGEVNLFTRPRWFGKSLNMSMLKAFFEIDGDKSCFDGLKITQQKELCEEYMGKFPVVSVSLRSIEGLDYERAIAALQKLIGEEAIRYSFLLESGSLEESDKEMLRQLMKMGKGDESISSMAYAVFVYSLNTLSFLLSKHYGRKTIILIDEYDAPLDTAYQNSYYDEMVSLICSLFGNALKGNPSLQFAVLTGRLHISNQSSITGLNNIKEHSITDVRYDEYFGFTDEDVQQLLAYYNLSNHANKFKEWYGGYRFGDISVYCPCDVVNYCDALLAQPDMEPENYWANTSGSGMVKRFIHLANQQIRDEIEALIAGECVIKEINQRLAYNEMEDDFWSALFTTGYLTARKRLPNGEYELAIPNKEIRELFISRVQEWFKETARASDNSALFEAMWDGDEKTATDLISDILFNTISYYDYRESYYHALIAGLFAGGGYGVESKYARGTDRPDVVVKDGSKRRAIVIEAKYADSEEKMAEACKEAIDQIKKRKYVEGLKGYRSVVGYGIAFFEKECLIEKL